MRQKRVAVVFVDYFEFRHDGHIERHTCRDSTARKLAKSPEVRFAALLGRIDSVPCPIETLTGSDSDSIAIRAAYEAAQG